MSWACIINEENQNGQAMLGLLKSLLDCIPSALRRKQSGRYAAILCFEILPITPSYPFVVISSSVYATSKHIIIPEMLQDPLPVAP